VLRRRLVVRGARARLASRLVGLILGAALVWYGLMAILLAAKADPETVNALSGYRTVYDAVTGVEAGDLSGGRRAIVAAAGLLLFLLLGALALAQLPHPSISRPDLTLASDERGEVLMEPRAVERLAELAAEQHPGVAAASGRYDGDELAVDVTVGRPTELDSVLRGVRERVAGALREHGLPDVPVPVTVTDFQPERRRKVS
jgi:hypothetical protein